MLRIAVILANAAASILATSRDLSCWLRSEQHFVGNNLEKKTVNDRDDAKRSC